MRSLRGPKLPRNLLHTMYRITREEGRYDPEKGGQFTGGKPVEVPFQGVVMPMNNEDLQYMDSIELDIHHQRPKGLYQRRDAGNWGTVPGRL